MDRTPLADPDEAGAFLGVTARRLEIWRSNGEGPSYVKVGGRVRYRRRDIESWLDSRRVVPANSGCGTS